MRHILCLKSLVPVMPPFSIGANPSYPGNAMQTAPIDNAISCDGDSFFPRIRALRVKKKCRGKTSGVGLVSWQWR